MSKLCLDNVKKPDNSVILSNNSNLTKCSDPKLTVLESFGYTLGKTIGKGSFATVKVAQSEHHNCYVAIKIIRKEKASKDYLKKFLPREIEVVKRLRHENLVHFHQAIETTLRVYIIMEYAVNGTLLDIVRKEKYIDETRARYWFKQLVNAVDYCHQRGIVHRDIKCDNVLLSSSFHIKLSDFGFAKGIMKIANGIYPLSSTFCGSYAYASPEILKGIPYKPQNSDIWSMGVVLYATVFGRLPFDDSNHAKLIKVQSKLTFPSKPKVSSECRKLIGKIIAPLSIRVKIPHILLDPWLNAKESNTRLKILSKHTNPQGVSHAKTKNANGTKMESLNDINFQNENETVMGTVDWEDSIKNPELMTP